QNNHKDIHANMNAYVLFALVAMAVASPQFNNQRPGSVGIGIPAPTSGFGGSQPGGGSGAFGGPSAGVGGPAAGGFGRSAAPQRNWGPKAYGPGLNNPFAFPPNPFFMKRALAIVNRVPGTLVRVETNGEISITDQFGREAEVLDAFGRDLTDQLEF
ncbi:unnamed protein product, partial [Meganyctiphanes norvegica]